MRSVFRLAVIITLVLASVGARAQVAPISGQVISQFGQPLPGASVRVCSVTSTGTPCSTTTPPVTIYLDYGLTVPIGNPYTADQYGNYTFYVPALASPNLYVVELSVGGGIIWSYVVPGPVTGGGGGGLPCTGTCTPGSVPMFVSGPGVANSPADYGVSLANTFSFLRSLSVNGATLQTVTSGNTSLTSGGTYTQTSTGLMQLIASSGLELSSSDSSIGISLSETGTAPINLNANGQIGLTAGSVINLMGSITQVFSPLAIYKAGVPNPFAKGTFDPANLISGDAFTYTLPRLSGTVALLGTITNGTSPVCPNGTGGLLTTVGCSGGGGGSSVGSAGQVQMVGGSAGSFAASRITDNGTTIQLGTTTPPPFLIGNTGILGSFRTHSSTNVSTDPTYFLLDDGNGTEYAFASLGVNLPAGAISLAGWYGGMSIQGNVNIGTTTPLFGINAADQAPGAFGPGNNMFSVLASKQVTTWNNTLDDGSGNATVITLGTAASTTAKASINAPPGTAPTSPVNGDFWSTSAGFFGRVAGVTVGPFGTGGGGISGSGTAGFLTQFTGGTTVGNSPCDNGVTTAGFLTCTLPEAIAGVGPGAAVLIANTGNVPALAAFAAGFAGPVTGGTSYLIKMPATITVGILHVATPATADGVLESVLTSSQVAIATEVSGLGTNVATFLTTPSSANFFAAITDETGSGLVVGQTSPTLITPILGIAAATSINKVIFTAPATSATLTLVNGSTLTLNGAFSTQFTASASATFTLPGASATLAGLGTAETWSALQTFGSNISIAATVHGVLLSENTGAVVATSAGTATQCFISNGPSADPTFQSCPGGGSALSAITAAAGANTIASGNNGAQVWNWAQTTASQTAFTLGETTAATGSGDIELAVKTLAGSTAIPLVVSSSLTGAQALSTLQVLPTWNTSGNVDAGIFENVTNTASGAGSLLIDLQIGSVSQFKVDKAGNLTAVGSVTAGATGGVGGTLTLPEGTAATGLAASDLIYALASSHRILMNNNNGTALTIVGIAAAGTAGHLVSLAANGLDIQDAGAQYSKGSCTEVWGGSGTSFALTSGDDAISNQTCLNDSGVTRTITAVKCRASGASNTTTVNPTFGAAGTGTTILSGALTCGSSGAYSSTGTVTNAAWATGNSINPAMGGTLTGTSIAMIVEYTF